MAAAAAALTAASAVHAATTVSWTGLGGDGLWGTAANWSSTPALPASTNDVVELLVQAITHGSGTDTINSFSGAGTFNLTGGALVAAVPGTGTFIVNNVFNLNGGTLRGFVINGGAGNSVTVAANNNNTFDNITVNIPVNFSSAGVLRNLNGLTLNSTLSLGGGGLIGFTDSQTLGGSGFLVFDSNANNRLSIDNGGTAAVVLTIGSAMTLRGQNAAIGPAVFSSNSSKIINNGTISADVAAGTFTLQPGDGSVSAITNTNLIQAANGGAILLARSVTNSGSGRLNVGNSSTFTQNGVTITGGTINISAGGNFVPINSGGNILDNVTINGDITTNSAYIEQIFTGLTLNGTVNVNSNSIIGFKETQTLGGTGTINFGSSATNRISLDTASAGTLTIGSNILIHGQNAIIGPAIFSGGTSKLVNNGTIADDVAGGSFTLQTSSSAADSIKNNNVIEAENGDEIFVAANLTNGATGHLDLVGASTLSQGGAVITGGTINTGSTGNFVPANNANNFLSGVTVNGNFNLSTPGIERVINGLTLNGTATIDNNSILSFQDTQSLSGSGTIIMGSASNNRLTVDSISGTLTVGSNTLVRGQNGSIGGAVFIGGSVAMVNNGTISDDVAGGSFTINPTNFVNNNVVRAINGGAVTAAGGTFSNTGSLVVGNGTGNSSLTISDTMTQSGSGRIDVDSKSNLIFSGGSVNGGTISSAGTIFFTNTNANQIIGSAVTAAAIDMANGGVGRFVNAALTLNGSATLNNNAVLSLQGTQTVSGTGSIIFGSTGPNNRLTIDDNSTITFGPNITIRGQSGTIGQVIFVNGTTKIINQGTIAADVAGGSITLAPNSAAADSVSNSGTLKALNGGNLILTSNITQTGTGQINVGANSLINQNNIAIAGGTITVAAGGTFTPSNVNSNFLNGLTVNGNLNMSAASSEQILNGLTLNGTISIDASSVLGFKETQTFGGTGTIVFGAGANNRLSIDSITPAAALTLGSNITLRGETAVIGPSIFASTTGKLINNGTISADTSGGLFTLDPPSTAADAILNNNLIAVSNGDAMILDSNLTNGASGHIDVGGSSTFTQNGAHITSGTITVSSGGNFIPTVTSANFLSGLVVNGNINMSAGGNERIANGITLNGVVTIDGSGALGFQETQTLNGTATIDFGAAANNRLSIDAAATLSVLTLGPGVLIHGQNGNIGPAVFASTTSKLISNGTISADVAGGTLLVQASSLAADSITDNNLFEARNGGTLRIDSNLTVGPSGSLSVADAASTMRFDAGIVGGRPIVNNGNLLLSTNSGGTVGIIGGTGTTTLTSAGTLNATYVRQAALAINGGTLVISPGGGTLGTSVLNSATINIANGSALNLNNHDLIVDYTGASPISMIRTFLQHGYNNGGWNQPGIISSSAAGSSGSTKTSLGYREASAVLGAGGGTFSGQPVDGTAVLIKYTYAADTNLDGKVDVTDLGILASHWQQAGVWETGDFNYDGSVNVTDLGILATDWQAGVGNPLGPGSFQQALAAFGLSGATVPEPATLGMIGLCLAGMASRRRRR